MESRYEDTIDAYLLGRMTDKEQKEFLDNVEKNEVLSKELLMFQELYDGITVIGDERERAEIAAIHVNEEDCLPYVEDQQFRNKRKKYFRYIAMAASVVLLAGISFFLLNQTKNEYAILADKYYEKYTEQDRGETNENTDQKDEAKVLLLSGIEYFEAKKYKQAVRQFETIIAENNPLYLVDAKWYAALSYLQLRKPDKAKELLQEIVTDDFAGKKNKQKARKLLTEIASIQTGR